MPTHHHGPIPADSGAKSAKLIDLQEAIPSGGFRSLTRLLLPAIERLLAIDQVNALHQSIPPAQDEQDFCHRCLSALQVDYSVTEGEIAHIPATGPLVTVANHPFGGLEGIILAHMLLQVRSDLRILANYLLTRIPALAPIIIPVDPIHPKQSARENARSLKAAMDWVAQGGALLTFPSGEVSHWNHKVGQIIDPPWSTHIAKLIMRAKAKVLPVYVHGRNSIMFNLMGMLHPRLRTAMLPSEMVKKSASTIELTVGKPIAWRNIADYTGGSEIIDYLRFSTYLLKHRKKKARHWNKRQLATAFKKKTMTPIIAPVPKHRLIQEIESLPKQSLLTSQKGFAVYLTTAEQSPGIMREIGRLREVTFRKVDEGTGKRLDIDRFDGHYFQLFLWNTDTCEIVGAYRVGQTDVILPKMGLGGLYSTTLFHYDRQFLNMMGSALELGRSFIRTEYQKKFGCLAILWRGIGAFVAQNPQYRYLFGPVSISQNYRTISKNMMVAFLKTHSLDPDLASLVRPKRPVKIKRSIDSDTAQLFSEKDAINGVSMLISEIEADQKGVPTLIKHYLKLNGRFLGFNLDRDFSNVIDGLVVVDLVKTDPRLAQRFLGKTGMQAFRAHHHPDVRSEAA